MPSEVIPLRLIPSPQLMATSEGQHEVALGESEVGLGYDVSPILEPDGPAAAFAISDEGRIPGRRRPPRQTRRCSPAA